MVKAGDSLADSLIVGSGFMEFISPGEKTMNLYLDSSQSQSIRARPTKVSSVSFCTSEIPMPPCDVGL